MAPKCIEVGHIAKPQGLKGEVRVNYYADSPDLLSGELYLQAGNQAPVRVQAVSWRVHQGGLVLRLEGVGDRTAAEGLRGQTLLVADASLPPPGEDEIYLHTLLGLDVVLNATGEKLGQLDDVLFHGEQEIWVIRTPDGIEVYLPAQPEFVPAIDLEAGVIRIAPPPGLLELYLPGPRTSSR